MAQIREVKKIYVGSAITMIVIACMLSFFAVSVAQLYKDDSMVIQAEERLVNVEKMQNDYYQILLGGNTRENFAEDLHEAAIPELEDGWNNYLYAESVRNTANMDATRIHLSEILQREVENARTDAARIKTNEYLEFHKQLKEIGLVGIFILVSIGMAFFFIIQGTKNNYEAYKELSNEIELFYSQSNLLVKEFRSVSGIITITIGNLLKVLDGTRDKTREREAFFNCLFKELNEKKGILNRGTLNDFKRRLIQFRRELNSDFDIIVDECEGMRRRSLGIQKRFRNVNWKVGEKNVF